MPRRGLAADGRGAVFGADAGLVASVVGCGEGVSVVFVTCSLHRTCGLKARPARRLAMTKAAKRGRAGAGAEGDERAEFDEGDHHGDEEDVEHAPAAEVFDEAVAEAAVGGVEPARRGC